MKTMKADQRGLAHIGIILVAVVVLAVGGFAGYTVIKKNKESTDSNSVAQKAADAVVRQAAKAECDKLKDDDLCKFFTSWKEHKSYRMTSTDEKGQKMVVEIQGDNSHIQVNGEQSYEMITIGKSTYTKAGATWYKQTAKDDKQNVANDYKPDIKEPEDNSQQNSEDNVDQTTYKKLGKEACGSLQCFKYQIVDPTEPDNKQYIWFDDKDYQLRKSRNETKDGVNEQAVEYANVSIKEPSPVKELQANQYVVPGSSEVMTLPQGISAPPDATDAPDAQ